MRGHYDGLFPRPEESYRLWCVVEYNQNNRVTFTSRMSRQTEVNNKKKRKQ